MWITEGLSITGENCLQGEKRLNGMRNVSVSKVQGKRKTKSNSSEKFLHGWKLSYGSVLLPWVPPSFHLWIWPLYKISSLPPSVGRETSPATSGAGLAPTRADRGLIAPSGAVHADWAVWSGALRKALWHLQGALKFSRWPRSGYASFFL